MLVLQRGAEAGRRWPLDRSKTLMIGVVKPVISIFPSTGQPPTCVSPGMGTVTRLKFRQ